jgi:hypothetical protein
VCLVHERSRHAPADTASSGGWVAAILARAPRLAGWRHCRALEKLGVANETLARDHPEPPVGRRGHVPGLVLDPQRHPWAREPMTSGQLIEISNRIAADFRDLRALPFTGTPEEIDKFHESKNTQLRVALPSAKKDFLFIISRKIPVARAFRDPLPCMCASP